MPDDVVIKITGDDSSAQAALGRTKTSIKQLGEQARTVGFGMAAIGAAVGVVAVSGVKAAVNFESAMAGVAKTVDGTTAEIAAMGAELQRLSTEIPITTNELAGIAETAGQLGIAKENIVDFAEVMAGLGVATNLTAEEAATSMARIANVTGLAQDKFDEMGSALVALGNNLATTEGEILTFAQRIAGAGKIAGLAESDILAIGGAMTSVGVQAEAGGTAVQKVLLGITEAVATSNSDLREFARVAGMSADEFAQAFEVDAAGAFTSFVEGLGRAGTDAFGILEELGLEDQRLIRSFLSLAGAGELLSDSIELSTQAFKDNTALTIETEKRYETAAAQMQIFKNEVTLLAVNIGNALLPVMQDMVDILKPVVQSVGAFIEQHPTLTKFATAAGVAVGILGTALVGVSVVLPGIKAGIMLLSGAMLALKVSSIGAMGALGPLGLALALGTVAGLAVTFFGKAKEAKDESNKFATVLNDELTPALDPTLTGAADAAKESLEHLPQALQDSIEKARGLKTAADELNAALMGKDTPIAVDPISEALAGRTVILAAERQAIAMSEAAEAFIKLRNSVADIPEAFHAATGPIVNLGGAMQSTRGDMQDVRDMADAQKATFIALGEITGQVAHDMTEIFSGAGQQITQLFFNPLTGQAIAWGDSFIIPSEKITEAVNTVEAALIRTFGEFDAFTRAFQAGTLSETQAIQVLINKQNELTEAIEGTTAATKAAATATKAAATASPFRNIPEGFNESGSIGAALEGGLPGIPTSDILTQDVLDAILAHIAVFGRESVLRGLSPTLRDQFIRQGYGQASDPAFVQDYAPTGTSVTVNIDGQEMTQKQTSELQGRLE